ncbi:MAG TPA: AAA family ATPase [Gemmatimonadaceae bacterium]|jgi:DNA-binding CsgD family transcriptional regulator
MNDSTLVCPVLVGRDAALAQARAVLERSRADQAGVVCVSGEAGVGKSRLMRAIGEYARASGVLVLTGACFEADRMQPYSALLDLVRMLVTTESAALAAHYFAPAAAALTIQFPELASVFGTVVDTDWRDAGENRRRLFHALATAFNTLSRVQPVLLVFEDLHWSDDATLDLVQHLAQYVVSDAVTIAMTFRSDEVDARLAKLLAELNRTRRATAIALRPLDGDQTTSMVRAILRADAPPAAAFARALHAMTDGNPFFIEEVLKAMPCDASLSAAALEHTRLPRTAIEAVVRRLALLSAPAQQIASVAAVAGRRFDFDLIHTITSHAEAELLEIMRELLDAQLVVEESADRFAFRHALTRDAIRSRLLGRERLALHRAIAAALDARSDSRTHETDDALAYHTFEAGMWEQARRHAVRAAGNALALGAPREALLQYERAVAASERLAGPPDPALLLARGRARETLGAFVQAHDDFAAALDIARKLDDHRTEWEALHALGLLWAARDYDRAGEYRRAALDVARALGDDDCIARSLNRVGNWLVNRERPAEGIPHHEEAHTLFARGGNRRGIAETVDLLGMAHHIAGDESRAVELFDQSIVLFAELDDRRGLVNALAAYSVCGPSYHASPGIVRSGQHAPQVFDERAIRLAAEIEWRAGEAFTRYLLADALGWRGSYARALDLASESLEIAKELEHREWQCGTHRVLGMIASDLGANERALTHLENAYRIAMQLQSASWLRWTVAPYAIGLARSGRSHDAVAVLDRIDREIPATLAGGPTLGRRWLALARAEVALATDQPRLALECVRDLDAVGVPSAALVRARAWLAIESGEDAIAALTIARDAAEAQGARGVLWRVWALEGRAHLAARRRGDARDAFDRAREIALGLTDGLDDDTLIASHRAEIDRLAPPPPTATPARTARAAAAGLTRREREAAALVASGLSNRVIGRRLGIGERTVETHVAGALSKLQFSSRAQLAAWATAQGIAAPASVSTSSPR